MMNNFSGLALYLFLPMVLLSISSCSLRHHPIAGEIKVVAGLNFTPGNVSVSADGHVFATKNAIRGGESAPNLIELTSKQTYLPFPNQEWNRSGENAADRINAAQGILVDRKNRVWITDHGNFISVPAQPKLLAFDIASKSLVYSYLFPPETAKVGSFIQHLAVDEKNGFVFISDLALGAKPALLVVDTKNSTSWRYEGVKEFQPENLDIYVSNHVVTFPDSEGNRVPARVGINAVTLSEDEETLFFGAMNGLSWYSLPAKLLREHRSIEELQAKVIRVGPKPICDGATTDSKGVHYFTNLGANAIDYLDSSGRLHRLVTDNRLRWPESVRVGPGGWLYVAASQLDRSPLLNGGKEEAKPPYLILKIYSGSPGTIGK